MSTKNPLVLDGDTVKLRIEAERQCSGQKVHIDWVRFTCQLRNAPIPTVELLFPDPVDRMQWDTVHQESMSASQRTARVVKELRELPDADFAASAQAFELAEKLAECLGKGFSVDPQFRRGMDFYKFRWSVLLNDTEVAWVGFLSSSESPRQQKQSATIHANVMGTACTFGAPGWNQKMADLVDETDAILTRSDLALDFFEGYQNGIDQVREDYRNGLTNVGGRKLKFSMVGDWENGHDRSIYIGSREAGKVTNIYEKGDQLYGEKAGSEWIRFELRYGNKLRVLSSEMLRRPDDFFAGASEWHHMVLFAAAAVASPEPVKCTPRLQIESVMAECSRNIRWMVSTAACTLAVAINHLSENDLYEMIGNAKLPGRLRKFSKEQIAQCFAPAVKSATGFPGLALVKVPGTNATYSLVPA